MWVRSFEPSVCLGKHLSIGFHWLNGESSQIIAFPTDIYSAEWRRWGRSKYISTEVGFIVILIRRIDFLAGGSLVWKGLKGQIDVKSCRMKILYYIFPLNVRTLSHEQPWTWKAWAPGFCNTVGLQEVKQAHSYDIDISRSFYLRSCYWHAWTRLFQLALTKIQF